MDHSSRLALLAGHLKSHPSAPASALQLHPTSGRSLENKVAVVTGGSRGIGKGCAVALAKAGARVYVTGKTVTQESLEEALGEDAKTVSITAVRCDHRSDEDTQRCFEDVIKKEGGVDILVNNATQGARAKGDGKFWEQDFGFYDGWMNVGLRSHYVCSSLVIRDMIRRGVGGVIVNISSFGAVTQYNSTAYAMGKTAIDRFVADGAAELKDTPISLISLYPGLVKTEMVLAAMGERVAKSKNAETPEFVGRAVVALASDSDVKRFSGKVVIAQELADLYGFTDIGGHVPKDKVMRGLRDKYMSKPPKHWQLGP